MQFKANATVVDADAKNFGHVRRVVIDPRTNNVVDLVVRTGTLVTEDRVVPIADIAESDGDHVRLRLGTKETATYPPFEDTFYVAANGDPGGVAVNDMPPASYWYPPALGYIPASMGGAVPSDLIGYEMKRERHIPDNTVALKEGASVKANDGHEVGKLEQVITAKGSDTATHIVVTDGMLHKTHRVIPLEWVDKIEEKEVKLAVSAQLVENLPAYEPAH